MSIIPSLFNNNETVKIICIGGIYDNSSGGVLGSEVVKIFLNIFLIRVL